MKTATQQLQTELKKTADDAVTLVRTTADSVQKTVAETTTDVKESAEQLFLAGLGAFALAEEEGSKLFKKLVKKGRKVELPKVELPRFGADTLQRLRAEVDARADRIEEGVKGRVQDARYMAGEAAGKAEDRLQEAVAAALRRLGVPTREEVAELTAGVERLTAHIEKLKKERAARPELRLEAVGGGWYEVKVGDVVVEKVQGRAEAEAALARIAEQQA